MSPLKTTKMLEPQSLTSAAGGAEQLEQPSAIEHVEVPQSPVAAPANEDAHRPLGPEPTESAMVEDG